MPSMVYTYYYPSGRLSDKLREGGVKNIEYACVHISTDICDAVIFPGPDRTHRMVRRIIQEQIPATQYSSTSWYEDSGTDQVARKLGRQVADQLRYTQYLSLARERPDLLQQIAHIIRLLETSCAIHRHFLQQDSPRLHPECVKVCPAKIGSGTDIVRTPHDRYLTGQELAPRVSEPWLITIGLTPISIAHLLCLWAEYPKDMHKQEIPCVIFVHGGIFWSNKNARAFLIHLQEEYLPKTLTPCSISQHMSRKVGRGRSASAPFPSRSDLPTNCRN